MEALFDDMLALCLEFAKNPQMQQIFARISSTSELNATMVVPLDKVIEMVRDLAKNPDMPQMMARMSAVSEKTFELSDANKASVLFITLFLAIYFILTQRFFS
jgi:hypothetical protein